MKLRIKLVKTFLANANIDGVVFASSQNRFWLTGFESTDGYIFVNNKGEIRFLVDGRYFERALSSIEGLTKEEIVLINTKKSLIEQIKNVLNDLQINKLAIESEYTVVTFSNLLASIRGLELFSFKSQALRITKDEEEIKCLKKAGEITSRTFAKIKSDLKIGMTEKQVSKMISHTLLSLGADGNSFDPIVAFGVNGANPHHVPTDKKLVKNEFITIDLGCSYKGYASDMTRTFILGKLIKKSKNDRMVKIYNAVREAHQKGIEQLSVTSTGESIDTICRNIISTHGYGNYFVHATGHGVGIDVHELPLVSSKNKEQLGVNSVVTVEPGVYVEGVGGVRIEDTILITQNGPVILTKDIAK